MINPNDVTIVMPAKNGEKWVLLGAKSFLNFNPEFKASFYVYNDESMDETLKMLNENNINMRL